MSLHSDKKKKYGIVPVSCGSKRGTAFFVSGGKLLTARHVVEEYFRHQMPVLVYMDDAVFQFKASNVSNDTLKVDVALLEPIVAIPDTKEYEWPLLAISFEHALDMHLTIAGYPEELGAGSSQITVQVVNHSEVSNKLYDILTVREDYFEMRVYCGFSGSPVISESGFVIGIVTTENFGKLGYCSVIYIKDLLKGCGITDVSTDWETNDDTVLSKKKSREQVEDAIDLAGSRYHKNNHQKDDKLMGIIDDFCIYKKYVKVGNKLAKVENEITTHPSIMKPAGVNYNNGDYDNLLQYIDRLLAYPPNTGTVEEILRHQRRVVELNLPRYQNGREKFLRIAGIAGTGKTHFSCYIAEYLENKAYPYLLFGSQFKTTESIFSQLAELLPFGGRSKESLMEGFTQLDARMIETQQFAVLIIDALNEGAGEFFWKDGLRQLAKKLEKYERIKLIVTIRDPFVNRIMGADNDWLRYDLEGFSSPQSIAKAMQSYFAEYGIEESAVMGFKSQFKLPLFLIIFCQSYGYLSEAQRRHLNRITLYKSYLKARNSDVATIVSEDEKRNITWEMMNKLALHSVTHCHAGVVPREVARVIADEVCRRELWKYNLLNALLKENLLMETLSKDDKDMVMFEFENIGDVLKANALLENTESDVEIIDLLKTLSEEIAQQRLPTSKFDNMVTALIAIWNKETDVLDVEEFTQGDFRPMLIRATQEYETEKNYDRITKWLDEKKSEYEPMNLLEYLNDEHTDLFNRFDLFLSRKKMNERDEEWTVLVNDFFYSKESWSYLEQKYQMLGQETSLAQARLLHLAIWMLTTSYPDSRQFLIGFIYRLLMRNDSQVPYVLEDFKDCDDHYLLTGLYCAVYGYLLRTKNLELVKAVADFVKKRYYNDDNGKVIADINLRQWTLMILDRAETLLPGSGYFSNLKLPFKSGKPTKRMLKNDIPEGYFGEGKGAAQLEYSLSIASDFYRYTIGGNSFSESREFFELDEKGEPKALKLDLILRMIAYIIKHDYKYTKTLDYYDANQYSRDRHHNKTERIGKKYQWLALWRVYAQLTDNYLFDDDRFYPEPMVLTKEAWPWNTNMYDRNDPTIPTFDEIKEYTKDFEFLPENDNRPVAMKDGKEWVDSEASHPVICTQYMRSNGEQWVLLYGYQSDKETVEQENRDRLLRYNCCFVKEKDNAKMKKWAAEQDFSGRSMVYHEDCIDFRWNEFPWSHAYKQLKRDEWVYENGMEEYPCGLKVSYDEQLQEEVYGLINEKEYHSFSAGMPCAELMETMGLYTAERGLVRRIDNNEVVAVSLSVLEDHESGLLIKKDLLCEFLSQKRYRLYCFISGNKEVLLGTIRVLHSKNLSACMTMDRNGNWSVVQGLRLV
ncbi:MAG: trypsin-like peptidase domain-containing protein [Prevotella sp.]|nr:trypsin-like peptidase domain-containing protein [Prevotella sp.]